MDNKKSPLVLPAQAVSRQWKVLGMLVLVATLGGCIGSQSKLNENLSAQDISENTSEFQNNISSGSPVLDRDNSAQNTTNTSEPNQIRLLISSKNLNVTGNLLVILKVVNPVLNESVLTVMKPQFGQEFVNQVNVTSLTKNYWTQNFSIKPKGNTSYVWMYVQISDNNTVVKRAAWNVTFEAPEGRPK